MTSRDGGVLSEREVERLLKRIDRMVPLEEADRALIKSSKRITLSRLAITFVWVAVFSSLWAVSYYGILAENSNSLSYILPRLAISCGIMVSIVFMRLTDRMKLHWAMVAAAVLFAVSFAMARG